MSSLEEKRRQRELERQKEIEELERKRKEREEKRKRDREELEKKEKELQERRRAKLAEIGSGSISSSFDSGLNSRLNSTSDGRLTSSDGSLPKPSGPTAEEERKKKEKEEAERKRKEKEEEERRKREKEEAERKQKEKEEEERKRKEKEEAERKQKEKEDEEKRKAALEAAARVPLLAKLPPPRGSEMDSELERLRKERERKAQERELRKKQAEEEAMALKKKLDLLKEQKEKELEEKMRKEEERKKELEEELRKQREQVEKLAREKEKEMDREMKREKERLERERLKAEREQREKEREEEKKRREAERKERERLEIEKREAEKRDREERERLRKEEERKRREDREAERARKLEADRQERERRKKEREEEERKEKEKEEQEKQRRLAERKAREEKEKLENEERERKRELERQEKEKALQAKRALEAEEEARMKKIQEEHAEEERLIAQKALLLKKAHKEKKKKEREEQMDKIRQEEEERKRKKEEEEAQKRLLEDDEEDEEIKQLKAQLEKLKAENERIAQEEKLREEKARAAAEERPKTSRTSSRRGTAAARQTSVEKMGINSPRIVVADASAAARDQAGLAKRSQSFRARKVLIPADEEDLMAIFNENREKTSSYRSGKKDSGGTRTSPSLPTVNSKEKAASSREKKNPVLIQLKGEKRVHVRKCETVATCFNYSDVFLLDAGDKIYQWNGPLANRNKRAKGVDVANAINKKQRGGGADVVIIEALIGEDDGAPKEFWAALGGKPETIPETKGNDAQLEKQWTESDKLYRVNPGGELFKIDGSITRAKLASNFVYVLDCTTEVYVWCGKETDAQKKEEAVRSAKRLFLKNERPPWSVLRRINEGAEPVLFVEKFAKWEVSKKKIGKAAALAANTGVAAPQPGGAPPRPVTKTESPQRRSGGFSEEEILKQYDKRYTYDQLLRGEYPASINTAKKEEYLSDAEFQTVFGMTKEVFYKQPAWKIRELKIKTKLF